mmetsp:Transcript_8307/g.8189  ORF Transcript_8307/g.8189 Transcript_8307/m.8189 type:complete len:296 (-) Transcript_8307:34-921(-)|eukprot:CAMPEP_0202947682 /NCGR_PEP_ID=MMETSP1395-20130829/11905_1 /ASSEMBLY_ACC=CAM_ASM_000871 /TAXON_ID=5961 /ORGANISM="Blepharisma japonicum, Strain Stock R1072" /LENGTH=295 /DNA_ID=CAMNT_0049649139 /DNA_START=12 /DNA_END=899 /DNA_ORIENTATION=+
MIIQIKNLRGEQTSLEIEPHFKVIELKRLIQTNQGHAVESQKLLYKGKILDDEKPLTDYQITENAILVLMVSHKKAPERPQPEQNQPADILVPQRQEAPAQLNEADVARLMEMGYSREEVVAALNAAHNNSAIAIEFLMSGYAPMPEGEGESAEYEEEEDEEDPGEPGEEITSTTFDFLLQSPEFQSIREVILQNPEELNVFLQQLETTNPELLTLINDNMDEFIRVLGGRRRQRGAVQIHLTPEEENDVRELIQLGFSQEDVIQVYLSCDKNKEMAASLLFENFQQNFQGQGFS